MAQIRQFWNLTENGSIILQENIFYSRNKDIFGVPYDMKRKSFVCTKLVIYERVEKLGIYTLFLNFKSHSSATGFLFLHSHMKAVIQSTLRMCFTFFKYENDDKGSKGYLW